MGGWWVNWYGVRFGKRGERGGTYSSVTLLIRIRVNSSSLFFRMASMTLRRA